jgi:hypothetical protein
MTDSSFVRSLYPRFAMCLLLRIRSMRCAARA